MPGSYLFADVDDLIQLAEQLDRSAVVVQAEMRTAMAKSSVIVQRAIQDKIQQDKIVDTGHFLRSIDYQRPVQSFFFAVGSDLDYSVNIQRGREAGARMPPDAPIREWAGRHGIPLSLVFVIRRAISVRGIKARPVFEPAYQASLPAIRREIVTAMLRIAAIVTARKGR